MEGGAWNVEEALGCAVQRLILHQDDAICSTRVQSWPMIVEQEQAYRESRESNR